MTEYKITNETPTERVRWVHDERYEIDHPYGEDDGTPEERAEAEKWMEEERKKLKSGEWVALCAIHQKKCSGECGGWYDADSLWGIVLDGSDKALEKFARGELDLESVKEGIPS